MNWHEHQFCRVVGSYYSTRTPRDSLGNVDMEALRGLWQRADRFERLPDIPPDESPSDQAARAAASALPGDSSALPLPRSGGLHLTISGELLPTLPAAAYCRAIAEATGEITIRLNSGGGDLAGAFGLHDALVAAGPERVSVLVAGFCGSAATLILAAAGRRRVVDGSRLWTHAPSLWAWGNARQLREAADRLDALLPRMRAIYGRICDPAAADSFFDGQDHFFDAQTALQVGLATELVQSITPEAA